MRQHIGVFGLICLGLVGCASAQGPRLTLPDFRHLRDKATDSVDITLGSFAFSLARHFVDDSDPEAAATKELLKGIRSVRVRHYEFANDFVYSKSEVDSVRSQLSTRGWNPLVQVRDHRNHNDVDVYIALEKEKITGLAIVASEPREFTIVNVVGNLDREQIETFREKFNFKHSDAEDAAAQL